MIYVDCFLAPVPHKNRHIYEEMSKISAKVVKEYGALRVVECWLDESGPEASSYHGTEAKKEIKSFGNFVVASGAGPDETVVMSYIEWPDNQTRDAGMQQITADPRMQFGDQPPAFDGSRLIAAGFKPMIIE